MQEKTYGAAEILRLLVSLLAGITGLTAIVLTLSIYFGSTGEQMYTVPLVQSRLRILLIPAVLWLIVSAAAAVLSEAPKKLQLAPKPVYPEHQKYRRVVWAAAAAAMVWILIYLCTVSNFASRDLEYTVGRMLIFILPAAAILLVCAYLLQKPSSPKPAEPNAKAVTAARAVIAAAALCFLIWGVRNGGMRDVLVKAINICTECIGLG